MLLQKQRSLTLLAQKYSKVSSVFYLFHHRPNIMQTKSMSSQSVISYLVYLWIFVGAKPKPRVGHEPKSNGCGSYGIKVGLSVGCYSSSCFGCYSS